MNKAMLTVGIIFLSLITLLLVNVLSSYSTGSELDYYLVKETTDAAISDSLDLGYLRTCGIYRIDREKFVESFLYRFADSVDSTRNYKVGFYDINEVPPKVSVKVDSLTSLAFNPTSGKNAATGGNSKKDYSDSQAASITTSYDAILESKYVSDSATEEGIRNYSSDACKAYN